MTTRTTRLYPFLQLCCLIVGSDAFSTPPPPPDTLSRRSFGLTLLTPLPLLLPSGPSSAAVYADPDRYGDKELKIATVNKLRQNIRDAILKNPAYAPLFLKIAIQDALTFNAETGEYGPDGSIIGVILAKDCPSSLQPLQKAAGVLYDIRNKIKKTTEITMADVVGFAGAEAIETAGGPRIVVQLGKTDPIPSASAKPAMSYPDLCGKGGGAGATVVSSFLKAGLSEREVALLYGVLVDMEAIAAKFSVDEEEEEENEMGDKSVFIPASFGAPSQIYGQQIGKITGGVYKDIVKDLRGKKVPVADVFMDEKVGGWANRYANNPSGFLKDLPEAYGKLMGLGLRYTGGKVGALLGGQESTL
mmetsp:Transcript_44392/g.53665  ORF Transcript_44392/g.53665 Transcript_44392/m.53665 type:complete len:360 (+) Transcript_44392:127-1206(+)|eukprot:CAMPEP_0172495470 /NCGR_PEP_ID=MMETSP1066-20121228/71392_1 /TAXON_ID=671091 /ORGANISM="Coscinodiscus wailesii, Strain CCMP2513" /LENGTH=359 /DNA_ID=CAMNT_0013267163 /DNA_START=117 /DNA_END=1196 /DNA_ORIENTATION=+